ncbi:MAG: SpoIIE family protein phosphatase [bacterium]|nr:SpoIIE family protein phosphatase [bacterium]
MVEPASILVVDDLQDNLELLCEHLDEDIYEVRTATSGQAAIHEIDRRPPDLVLLDVMMPGMDGIETCRRIKERTGDAYLPVVLITAYNDSDNRRRGLEAGAEDFVTKPFSRVELLARIRNLLHTKRLYDDLRIAKGRIEAEIDAVGALQRSLIPTVHPDVDQLRFHDFYLPSRQAGGDFFDFIPMDNDHLGIAIGDVSGHGPPASVLMAMVKMILRTCRAHWREPARLLRQTDAELSEFVPAGEFVTMFYGVFDLPGRTLHFASAGHCPPILFGPRHDPPLILKTDGGFPLCLIRENRFDEQTISFIPGSRLLLYTDGLIEVQNAERELFGLPRLQAALANLTRHRGDEIVRRLLEEARAFNSDDHFRDDCTMLLIDCVR